jgi:hypothetical protein
MLTSEGGENSEATLDYFWKIFDLYFEISNFLLDFLTTISTNLFIPKVRNAGGRFDEVRALTRPAFRVLPGISVSFPVSALLDQHVHASPIASLAQG